MNNISETINIVEIIGVLLFVTFVYSNFISLIKARETDSTYNSKSIPDFLMDFPNHDTSNEAYLKVKNKIERFINLVLSDRPAMIEISEQEINDLHTKGIAINKKNPGKHLYYKISNSSIIEYLVEFPVKLSKKTYRKRIKERIYLKDDLNEYTRIIEENNLKLAEKLQPLSLKKSTLLLFIFNGLRSPDSVFYKFKETLEYQKAASIIEKIDSIEISNNTLIIRS